MCTHIYWIPLLQLVPYIGEGAAPVRVDPCGLAVSQERQEVLEVSGETVVLIYILGQIN